ncbi:restriction endonuclease subunit S [Mesorhizobium sp.]|uniref:restriction endonuclease subunit S n=1 Tax=Mesorhizobium sp. TaxID=1871066 RepID=UPI000FE9A895|nr:restriction endonuclease subunit S [Mesorhizobium sp.]RWP67769.1 MAG: restriction endonuclease subunit S [Mesorhizobium sp.]
MTARWQLKRLGDIFEVARDGSPRPIEQFITDRPDGLNWIKIGDASASGKFIERTKEKIKREGLSKTRFVSPGDFLLTNSMSFGRPYIMATEGCIHDGWLVLKPRVKDAVHPDYFYHLLGSDAVYNQFAARAGGSTVKNLNSEIVASIEVRLPPVNDQRRIAATLDKADALRRKRKRAIELLDSLTQSIFLEMFGDPDTNPKRFQRGVIGDLLEDTQYGTSAKAGEAGAFPILRMGNVTNDGRIVVDDLKFIDLSDKEVEKYTVRKGDILFNRTNSVDLVGKSAVFGIEEPFAFAGYLVRARTKNSISPHYVAGYLNSRHGKATLRNMAKSIVGMANINAKEMASISILIPDADSQHRYTTALTSVGDQRMRLEKQLRHTNSLFSSLQSRAFSGQL